MIAMTIRAACLAALLLAAVLSASAKAEVVFDADVNAMIEGITKEELAPAVRELSGDVPATIGGIEYLFSTRSSFSGEAIDMAEQYVHEHLVSYGLDSVDFDEFPGEDGAPPAATSSLRSTGRRGPTRS